MVWWLTEFVVLPKDWTLVRSTHMLAMGSPTPLLTSENMGLISVTHSLKVKEIKNVYKEVLISIV